MAEKQYYHDIDLLKVSQIKNGRIHNVTSTERSALGGTLGAAHAGLHVWDTTQKLQFYWDGTQWVDGIQAVIGAMVYKGSHSDLANAPSSPDIGFVYVLTQGGTLTWAGQTFEPDAQVQVNDQIVYRGSNVWDVLQGDADEATETTLGLVELATSAEVNAGSDATKVVTPATLSNYATTKQFGKLYFTGSLTLAAATPLTVTHNLGLSNKDAFTIRVADSSGSDISVDVDSVDVNSLTLTSAVPLSGVKATVVGF